LFSEIARLLFASNPEASRSTPLRTFFNQRSMNRFDNLFTFATFTPSENDTSEGFDVVNWQK
jgi:hypothetical protein